MKRIVLGTLAVLILGKALGRRSPRHAGPPRFGGPRGRRGRFGRFGRGPVTV